MDFKRLVVYFTGFWHELDNSSFTFYNLLKHHFMIKYNILVCETPTYEAADLVIGSVFVQAGTNINPLNKLCIQWSGERDGGEHLYRADFYALSRFEQALNCYYVPYCLDVFTSSQQFAYERERNIALRKKQLKSLKWCCFVVSNPGPSRADRDRLFEGITTHVGHIESAGRYRNNMPNNWTVPGCHSSSTLVEFFAKHSFVLSTENTICPGYITEKIVRALQAGTVPIYWGCESIKQILNPATFIYAPDYKTMQDLCNEINRIKHSEEAYLQMLAQPLFMKNTQIELWDHVNERKLFNELYQKMIDRKLPFVSDQISG